MTFREAVEELERLGISGADVYLIDLLPLIELILADGRRQEQELRILEIYSDKRLEEINRLAAHDVLTEEGVRRFSRRYLDQPPGPAMVEEIRSLLATVLLSNSDPERNRAFRSSLLATALDLGASNVKVYPYPEGRYDVRFCFEEKKCFMALLAAVQ